MPDQNPQESVLFTLEQAKALLQPQAPNIIVPVGAAPKTPEQGAKGHNTTTMVFDKPVHLTVDTNDSIFYPAGGVHEVPDHLVDHWYLGAHGARVYSRPVAAGDLKGKKAKTAAAADDQGTDDTK